MNMKEKKNLLITDTINLSKIKNFRDEEIKNMLIKKIEIKKPQPSQIIEEKSQKIGEEKKSNIHIQDTEIDWKYVTGQMIMQAFQEKQREDKIHSLKTKSEVYTKIFDDQTQAQVFQIVQQRLLFQKKKDRQFKVLQGQICGIDGRFSEQSEFISDQIKNGLVMAKKTKDILRLRSLESSPLKKNVFIQNNIENKNEDLKISEDILQIQTDKSKLNKLQIDQNQKSQRVVTFQKEKANDLVKKQDIIKMRRKSFNKKQQSFLLKQNQTPSLDSQSSPKKSQRKQLEMFNDPDSIKDINFVKKKANLINKRNQKIQIEKIKEKPYLDPQNLNKDKFMLLSEQHLASERFNNRLISQVSQDRVIESMLQMINEPLNLQLSSLLQQNWVKKQQFVSVEANADEILIEYTRFLLGVKDSVQSITNSQSSKVDGSINKKESEFLIKFNELVEKQKNKIMVQIADDINEQIKYINIFRDGHTPGVIERESTNPTFIYFKKCVQYHELSLPIMKYVYKRTFCLQNYRLGIAQVKALSKSWQFFEFKGINRAMLDNCDINDNEFSLILKSINKLKDFKQIFYRSNTFSFKSIKQMESIFQKKIPFHLEQLTIENCKIEKEVTRQLLQLLNQKSYIKKLGLINIGLEEDSFLQFCQLIKNSLHIIEFDISYSQIRPKNFAFLCEILANNKTLVDINLSNNRLVEFQEKYSTEQNFERGDYMIEDYQDQLDPEILEQSQKIVDDLVMFMKKNPNIVHVDLSNTGLTEKHLFSFGVALRRTKSLRSIHLSGNQITENVVDYLVEKSHGSKFQRFKEILLTELPSEIQFKQDMAIFKSIQEQYGNDLSLDQDSKILNGFNKNQFLEKLQLKMKDAAQIQFIDKHKKMEEKNIRNYEIEKNILVISRLIGHKDDMPGSGRWNFYQQSIKEKNDCWICDKQIYTLIFWNQAIGEFHSQKFDISDYEYIINHLQNINSQLGYSTKQEQQLGANVPSIFGEFTGWKAMPMIDVRVFCDQINQKKPNIFEMCKKNGIIQESAQSVEDLDKSEKKKYEKEVLFYFNSYNQIWKEIIFKYLKYQEPLLVNSDLESLINNQTNPLYIFPTFLRGGKNLYVIKSEMNGKSMFHPGSFIAHNREEPVMKYNVVFRRTLIARKFIKEASVFAQWKNDDPLVLKNCLDHDIRYWKIQRFVKDPEEYNDVIKVIKKNFEFLKNTHIYLTCKSQFPSIFMNDFTIFARKAKFIDKYLNQSSLDRLFIASNFELEDQEDNPDTALIRFEFIELLMRIAVEKYKKPGKFSSYAQSLEFLIQENLVQASNHSEWQQFRDKQLYTVEVNDVFEGNLVNLKKVYGSYLSINQKHLTMDNVMDLFTKKSDCCLSQKDALFCYGMSKMTVANENENNKSYFKLLFVEFLEMIGRVADFKFQGSEQENLPLHSKIEFIIDELLVILPGIQRKKIEVFDEEETESNSDY